MTKGPREPPRSKSGGSRRERRRRGEPDRVIAMREDFQRVMAERYTQPIEELTGRTVLAFLSQAHVEPDITMEIFFVDGPLEGFGAVEVTEPE